MWKRRFCRRKLRKVRILNKPFSNQKITSVLFVFANLLLLSTAYSSWVIHIERVHSTWPTEIIANVFGSLFQIAGILLYSLMVCYKPDFTSSRFVEGFTHSLFFLTLIPSLYSRTITGTFFYGFVMNVFIGIFTAAYLHALTYFYKKIWVPVIVGVLYLIVWGALNALLAIADFFVLNQTPGLLIFAAFCVLCAILAMNCLPQRISELKELRTKKEPDSEEGNSKEYKADTATFLLLALFAAMLSGFSAELLNSGWVLLVKYFPSVMQILIIPITFCNIVGNAFFVLPVVILIYLSKHFKDAGSHFAMGYAFCLLGSIIPELIKRVLGQESVLMLILQTIAFLTALAFYIIILFRLRKEKENS